MTRRHSILHGRWFVVASALYLAAVSGVMIWRRIVVTPDYLLVVLVPVAVLSGRLSRWVADWVPFVAVLLAWEAMRGVAPHLMSATVHMGSLRPESFLFHGKLPTVALQHHLDHGRLGEVVNDATTIVYFCHFPATLGVGMMLWLTERRAYLRYVVAMVVMCLFAFTFFVVYPTAPPWWAADHGAIHGMRRIFEVTLPSSLSPYYRSLDPNPVAAVPSLHAAMPFLGFLAIRSVSRRGAWAMLAWCGAVWFSVVYLGEHYAVDVVTGIVLASACWVLTGSRLAARLAGRPQPAPAPRAAAA